MCVYEFVSMCLLCSSARYEFLLYIVPIPFNKMKKMRRNVAIRSLHTSEDLSMNGRVWKIMAAINEHMRNIPCIQQLTEIVVGTTEYRIYWRHRYHKVELYACVCVCYSLLDEFRPIPKLYKLTFNRRFFEILKPNFNDCLEIVSKII